MCVLKLVILFVVLGILPTLSTTTSFASEAYYDQLFSDDRLDITLALGFEQAHSSVDFPILGPISDVYRSSQMDRLNSSRDVQAIEDAILGCRDCGFRTRLRDNGRRQYETDLIYKDRLVKVRLNFLFVVNGVSGLRIKRAFISALQNDDVIMYVGHARNGRGFPDFGSPLGAAGKVFIDDVLGGWMGFEKGYFSPTKYQILSVHACQTDKYFRSVVRKNVWEKKPSKLALLLTSGDSWFEDYPQTSVAFIRSLLLFHGRQEILENIERAAVFYYGQHLNDDVVQPLFVADGFFDESYAHARQPKRKLPQEPWQAMPF